MYKLGYELTLNEEEIQKICDALTMYGAIHNELCRRDITNECTELQRNIISQYNAQK